MTEPVVEPRWGNKPITGSNKNLQKLRREYEDREKQQAAKNLARLKREALERMGHHGK